MSTEIVTAEDIYIVVNKDRSLFATNNERYAIKILQADLGDGINADMFRVSKDSFRQKKFGLVRHSLLVEPYTSVALLKIAKENNERKGKIKKAKKEVAQAEVRERA